MAYDEAMHRMATRTAERRARPAVPAQPIGMRIRGGVTSHGFALNIDPDLSVFDSFVACGLDDVVMASLRRLAIAARLPLPAEAEIRDAIARRLEKQL